MDRGVCYVVYGEKAANEATISSQLLKRLHPDLPISVVGDRPISGCGYIPLPQRDAGGRWAKLNLERLSPYSQTLYIDADTRPHQTLDAGFDMLRRGWELVIAPSQHQGVRFGWHIQPDEVAYTRKVLGFAPLQWQGGVFYFQKCPAITRLFQDWRHEWRRFEGQDQAALVRALYQMEAPPKIWALGHPYNASDGAVISHLFGRARA